MENSITYLILNYLPNEIKTNPIIITLITPIIIDLMKQIKSIYPYILIIFYKLYNWIIRKKEIKDDNNLIIKIKMITSKKDINELYPSIIWYLSTLKKEIKETNELEYYYLEEITYRNENLYLEDKKRLVPNKLVGDKQIQRINFKEKIIEYSFISEKVDFNDKQKDNFIIILKTGKDNQDLIDEFCQYCLIKYIESKTSYSNKQKIYKIKDGKWILKQMYNKKRFDNIILKDDLQLRIEKIVKHFVNNENHYYNLDIPYTLGILLYGPPGTGKTSIIKAIANVFERDIYSVDFTKINTNEKCEELFEQINFKKSLIAIEDIDTMGDFLFDRNKEIIIKDNKDNKDSLNLGNILDLLDGLQENHGRILIMTTNYKEKLDHALIRPGRIDYQFELGYCDENQINKMFQLFLNKECNNIKKHVGKTPAELSNLLRSQIFI